MNYEIVEEIDNDEDSYQWDVFGVLRFEDGTLAYGSDGGCSCNYAWDDVKSPADMDGILTPETWDAFAAALDEFAYSDEAKAEGVQVKKRMSLLIGWGS